MSVAHGVLSYSKQVKGATTFVDIPLNGRCINGPPPIRCPPPIHRFVVAHVKPQLFPNSFKRSNVGEAPEMKWKVNIISLVPHIYSFPSSLSPSKG